MNERKSRIEMSFKNAKVNTICYFASLVVAFFTRKVLLDHLGAEFIGFSGTLCSILGFLNLAELGVGVAIGYVLYKPIFENNREQINEIISVLGYVYRIIGFVILGAGVVVSLFLPLIFPDTSFSWTIIYCGYYAYLAASLLGYFVNYKMNLLAADQKNYVITGYFQLTLNIKIVLQMLFAYLTHSFIIYILLELLTGIVNSIIIQIKVRKIYPWLDSNIKEGHNLLKKYPEIFTYVKQLFIHKIGGFAQFQLTPLLIYSYVSLPVVALYTNYTIITQRMSGLIGSVLDLGIGASVGNLISEGNQDKIYKTYQELMSFRFFLIGIVSVCLYKLINPFIEVWLGAEYILPHIAMTMVVALFILTSLRGTTGQFINGYGLFYDIWAPLVEAGIFIIVGMIGGSVWGLPGVLLGPICSLLIIVHIWKPIFLYKCGFHKPIIHYVGMVAYYFMLISVATFLSETTQSIIPMNIDAAAGWIEWIEMAMYVFSIQTICSLAVFLICSSNSRRLVCTLVRAKLHKK